MNPFNFKTTAIWLTKAENTSDANSNQLKMRLLNPLHIGGKAKVALTKLNLDYSFYNISSTNNNNYFSYVVDEKEYKVEFDNGMYDVSALNAKLEATMYTNNHYLTNSSGAIVYYLNLRENTYTNRITLTASVVPGALPAGWTDAGTFITDAGGKTLQLSVPDTSVATLLGFPTALYPTNPSATTYNVDSTNVPVLDVVSSLLVQCNLVSSSTSTKTSGILFAFTIPNDAQYPGIQNIDIFTPIWMDCNQGYFGTIQLDFLDQDGRPIVFSESRHIAQLQIIEPN